VWWSNRWFGLISNGRISRFKLQPLDSGVPLTGTHCIEGWACFGAVDWGSGCVLESVLSVV
jgi:hypothetical protein